MSDPIFFRRACEPSLAEVVAWTGARPPDGADLAKTVSGVAPIDQAGPGDLVFLDNPKYATGLAVTRAVACLLPARHVERVPSGTVALVTEEPYRAFALVVGKVYPEASRPGSLFGATGVSPGAIIHPEARLESGVIVDPGAVIGPRAEIGEGTVVGANAVIGPDVRIGRACSVGPNCTIVHALVGDRVILHAGVRVGQDGFGFAMGPRGHLKIPQVGRVIIQDDVEIGAGTTIDRGANRDTLIGEGTKIDNLVQIGHNVVVGRHCVIVAQAGISGSCTLGDFVAIGGQAGLTGHLNIGTGAQIAASAGLMNDVPAGERWVGAPAQPHRDFFREVAAVRKLVRRNGGGGKDPGRQ
ncbi:MAG: UDP-3-O-(3-hydroxymyristoyl)glucosamine N-acyltransferase [Methylobacteriaceae bacterium]|nr:UDP-3-O-(3-hydroxymyristoyl)glucosamine N-acyltransferase [Methylobacteriaceae bacterium]